MIGSSHQLNRKEKRRCEVPKYEPGSLDGNISRGTACIHPATAAATRGLCPGAQAGALPALVTPHDFSKAVLGGTYCPLGTMLAATDERAAQTEALAFVHVLP